MIIDHERELEIVQEAANMNIAPKFYGKYHKGYVYGYIPGRSLLVDDVRDPEISEMIADTLAAFHNLKISGDNSSSMIFQVIRKWYKLAKDMRPQIFSDYDWDSDIRNMEANYSGHVVFSHNDLLPPNIVLRSDIKKVSFIDYEYAGYNYAEFDIGNHFIEWMGFECNVDLYPTREQRLQFLRWYLNARSKILVIEPPTQREVDDWLANVDRFVRVSHLYWGLWYVPWLS